MNTNYKIKDQLQTTKILLSFDRNQLVANKSCTRLFHKQSFQGRFWRIIHWFSKIGEPCLQKTLASYSNLIQTYAKEQKDLLDCITQPGLLGDYWKKRDVYDVKSHLNTIMERHRSLSQILEKAHKKNSVDTKTAQSLEEMTSPEAKGKIKIAEIKMERAFCLANLWQKNIKIPFELLYRELHSRYPSTDKELSEKRNQLQTGAQEDICPASLLYSPLIALARDLATSQITFEELDLYIQDLVQKDQPHNGPLLLALVAYFRNPKPHLLPSQLPDSVKTALTDLSWIQECSLGGARSWIRTEGRYERMYVDVPNFVYSYSYTGNSYVPCTILEKRLETRKTHTNFYFDYNKLRDGQEAITFVKSGPFIVT